jgi:tRNA (adenine37-N6)-methyltransferase
MSQNGSSKNYAWIALSLFAFGESLSLLYLVYLNYNTSKLVKDKEAEIEKQTKLRAVERAGRISVQQTKRNLANKNTEENGYTYNPIGFVESPFPDRRGTPRQPSLVPAAKGRIRFDKKVIQHEHFKEIGQFSHIWVVFVFHNNTDAEKQNKIAKIKPPRLHGAKVGCLSTRSPHRPNNIGLSVCEVVGVGEDFIEVRGIDMVNGTPVLDGRWYNFSVVATELLVYRVVCDFTFFF